MNKMFFLLGGLMGLAVVFFHPLPAPAADLKIATVDMSRIFDEHPKTRAANERFKALAEEKEKRGRELFEEAGKLKQELKDLAEDAKDASLNEAERNKRKELAGKKYSEYLLAEEKLAEYDKGWQQDLAVQMKQVQADIVLEIRGVIQKHIESNAYTLVLDSSGKSLNNVEAVLFADKSHDLTDVILNIIKQSSAQPSHEGPGSNPPEKQ